MLWKNTGKKRKRSSSYAFVTSPVSGCSDEARSGIPCSSAPKTPGLSRTMLFIDTAFVCFNHEKQTVINAKTNSKKTVHNQVFWAAQSDLMYRSNAYTKCYFPQEYRWTQMFRELVSKVLCFKAYLDCGKLERRLLFRHCSRENKWTATSGERKERTMQKSRT